MKPKKYFINKMITGSFVLMLMIGSLPLSGCGVESNVSISNNIEERDSEINNINLSDSDETKEIDKNFLASEYVANVENLAFAITSSPNLEFDYILLWEKYVIDVSYFYDTTNEDYGVSIELSEEGEQLFEDIARDSLGKQLYIWSNGVLINCPIVKSINYGSSIYISGLTKEKAIQIQDDISKSVYYIKCLGIL